jgi:hypothetical protein
MQVEHGRYSPLVQYAGPRAGGIAGQSKVQQPPGAILRSQSAKHAAKARGTNPLGRYFGRRAEGVAAEAHVDN